MKNVLMFGATGGCGSQALSRLLEEGGVHVTAIVRDEGRLPMPVQGHKNLTVVVASAGHLDTTTVDLEQYLIGCDAVISALGHNLTFSGVFGAPRRLCGDTTSVVCSLIKKLSPAKPIKFIVIGTEAVDRLNGSDPRRGLGERFLLALLWLLLPPHADNMEVMRVIQDEVIGADTESPRNPYVEFCVVRPSDLVDGEEMAYTAHENLQNSLFNTSRPSTRASVGRFMANLVTKPELWLQWKNQFPHILDCAKEAGAEDGPEDESN